MDPTPFRDLPVVKGERLRLEPEGLEHFDGIWAMLNDADGKRLTGTDVEHDEETARRWVGSRQDHDDRADFAVVRNEDDLVLGEVVLNEYDPDDAVCNFRIGLRGPEVFGRGYGTEATGLVLDYAFVVEGVRRRALRWEDDWHDVVLMGILDTDPRPRAAR